MKKIAIIPLRKNSKGILGKNKKKMATISSDSTSVIYKKLGLFLLICFQYSKLCFKFFLNVQGMFSLQFYKLDCAARKI